MTEVTLGPWECFQDASYYDMWCVRQAHNRTFGHGFHLVNGEEAARLRDHLNTRPASTEPVDAPKQRPWCETCGKDVHEVLCPTCAKWWNDNPPPADALAEARTSNEYHQKRGMLADAVDALATNYDDFMTDDRFDAWEMLHKLGQRLRELREFNQSRAALSRLNAQGEVK